MNYYKVRNQSIKVEKKRRRRKKKFRNFFYYLPFKDKSVAKKITEKKEEKKDRLLSAFKLVEWHNIYFRL